MKLKPKPLANYPHIRRAGDFLIISGASARQGDGSIPGAETGPDGARHLDIRKQTVALIDNLKLVLADAGAGLGDLVELNCFLVDMADYAGFNEVYNGVFDAATGPARTTVGVRELPEPNLLIEIKGLAWKPLTAAKTEA